MKQAEGTPLFTPAQFRAILDVDPPVDLWDFGHGLHSSKRNDGQERKP